MATNGMTINGLNPLSALTADDKIPVWDTGASGEPTKEITAQNMANSVKSLASLPNTTEMNNAIAQSTATTRVGVLTDTVISIGPFTRMGTSEPINGTIINVTPIVPSSNWVCVAEIDAENESRFFLLANGETNIVCRVYYKPAI